MVTDPDDLVDDDDRETKNGFTPLDCRAKIFPSSELYLCLPNSKPGYSPSISFSVYTQESLDYQ